MNETTDRLRVRVWADEPPGNSGHTFIALRRRGNDQLQAALVSIGARGGLMGWRWQGEPTHWLPLLPIGSSNPFEARR